MELKEVAERLRGRELFPKKIKYLKEVLSKTKLPNMTNKTPRQLVATGKSEKQYMKQAKRWFARNPNRRVIVMKTDQGSKKITSDLKVTGYSGKVRLR